MAGVVDSARPVAALAELERRPAFVLSLAEVKLLGITGVSAFTEDRASQYSDNVTTRWDSF